VISDPLGVNVESRTVNGARARQSDEFGFCFDSFRFGDRAPLTRTRRAFSSSPCRTHPESGTLNSPQCQSFG
jgi:hypothetical protein